jgi:hypothetical protein
MVWFNRRYFRVIRNQALVQTESLQTSSEAHNITYCSPLYLCLKKGARNCEMNQSFWVENVTFFVFLFQEIDLQNKTKPHIARFGR